MVMGPWGPWDHGVRGPTFLAFRYIVDDELVQGLILVIYG